LWRLGVTPPAQTREPAAISARMKAGAPLAPLFHSPDAEMPLTIRSICAAVVAGVVSLGSVPAAAQTAVLYGLLDASGSHVKDVGSRGQWQLDSGNLQRSFIGVRGSDDLGGGLRAVFRLESYLRVDSGNAGRASGDPFWSREASVGLSGQFGTTVLGRTVSPLYSATISFNPFGESAGFSPSSRQYFGSRGVVVGDSRWDNSISYYNSATDAPLRITFAANLPEEPAGAPHAGRNYGGSIAYITGPFAAIVAVERIKNSPLPVPAGFSRQVAIQVGATYDFTILRVYGQVGRVETNADIDDQAILYQLGAAVPIGNSLILASYGNSHLKSSVRGVTSRILSIGYDYFLSKNTDIYVAAMLEKLSFVSSGNTFASGVRMRF
jgi:predicted porin